MSNVYAQIEKALIDCNYTYTHEIGRVYQEFHITSDLPYGLFIRTSRSEFVRIHYWVELDKPTVSEKRTRLLDFCNITSWGGLLNAKLYDEGVDISYTIPDGAGDALGRLVINALYEFFTRIDHTMLAKALETEDDLYKYYEDKLTQELEKIKKGRNTSN